jgi:hypothetical protein
MAAQVRKADLTPALLSIASGSKFKSAQRIVKIGRGVVIMSVLQILL